MICAHELEFDRSGVTGRRMITGTLAEKIRRLRHSLKLNQTQFGERVGVSQGQVSKWEKGEDTPRHEFQVKIARLAKTSLADLTGQRAANEHSAVQVSVVGYVGGGAEVVVLNNELDGGELDTETLPPVVDGKLIAVEVRGESMYPAAEDGWRLVYSERRDSVEPDILNRLCVVGLADDRAYVKKVVRGSEKNRYHLMSTNAPLIENAEIAWVAKVLAIIPR